MVDAEEEKTQSSERERKCSGGCEVEEEEKGQTHLQKYPSLFYFFLISNRLTTSTASLVRIPNSKPESLIRPSIDYSFQNMSRFSFNKPRN